MAGFIRSKADPSLASRISDLTNDGLSYLEYNWSLNDAARIRAAPRKARRGMGDIVLLSGTGPLGKPSRQARPGEGVLWRDA